MSLRAISFFTNCGAGDVGYQQAGFRFRIVAEKETRRLEVARLNLTGDPQCFAGDVRDHLDEIVEAWEANEGGPNRRLDLLCACPPCQGMSSARAFRRGETRVESNDRRNLLIEVVVDAIRQMAPRAVVLENVPQFLTRPVIEVGGVKVSAPQYLLQEVGEQYEAYPVVLDLADFGVPQRRRRTFVTLLRRDEPAVAALRAEGTLPYPAPWPHRKTMEQALREVGLAGVLPKATYSAAEGDTWVRRLHVAPEWAADDRRRRMVEATALNGGSAWDNVACSAGCENAFVAPEAAVCGCGAPLLRPVVRSEDGTWRLVTGFRNTSYRRHDGRDVSATITTASGHVGSDTTLHPTEHRLLSVAECGVLQTFPESFDWGDAPEAWGMGPIRAMIGEAVPPRFTAQHGHVLARLLGGQGAAGLLPATDARYVRTARKLPFLRSRQELTPLA